MAQRSKENISIVEPAIRKDFWEFLISRHPIEEEHAPSSKNAYRWRHLPKLRLVIAQFVGTDSVGVFVRGERGANQDDLAKRLGLYEKKLKTILELDKFCLPQGGKKYFLHKQKSFNASSTKNWSRMADWLHREADTYESALYKVVEQTSLDVPKDESAIKVQPVNRR